MWLITGGGFLSVVEYDPRRTKDKKSKHATIENTLEGYHAADAKTLSTHLMVRARVKADLDFLVEAGAELGETIEVYEDAKADYLWRCVASRAAVKRAMANQIDAIDYSSHVKESLTSRMPKLPAGSRSTSRYAALSGFWSGHAAWQDKAPYGGFSYGGDWTPKKILTDSKGVKWEKTRVNGKVKYVRYYPPTTYSGGGTWSNGKYTPNPSSTWKAGRVWDHDKKQWVDPVAKDDADASYGTKGGSVAKALTSGSKPGLEDLPTLTDLVADQAWSDDYYESGRTWGQQNTADDDYDRDNPALGRADWEVAVMSMDYSRETMVAQVKDFLRTFGEDADVEDVVDRLEESFGTCDVDELSTGDLMLHINESNEERNPKGDEFDSQADEVRTKAAL
jgi:hypothetical protein